MAQSGAQPDPGPSGRLWSFAGREFDESRLELRVHGRPVELELKPLEILLELLRHAGDVVTKDQLLDAVWPGLSVVEGSLTTAVYKLRKALGDEDSSIVVTVPRVGYRLAATVHSRVSRPSEFPEELTLSVGRPVPGREQWRLLRPLEVSTGRGVWLAEHPKTRELRVFKFAFTPARFKALRREVTVFRFLRESLGARPEFVRIFEWNFETHPYFLETEYGGPNLAEWAEKQGGLPSIPLTERVRMLATVAQAVAAAHHAGVLHKDLKPANVVVASAADGKEQIKILDFGSAVLAEPSRLQALGITNLGFTQTVTSPSSSLTGTILYLAPEVLTGHSPTAATDVYALGVMLYQSVIGDFRKPLAPGWEAGVPDPLLRDDIAQAVCGEPAQRLPSAAELAERLLDLERRRIEFHQRAQAHEHQEQMERQRADARARRPWVAFATLALLALAASLAFYRRPPAAAPDVPRKSVAVLPFQNVGPDRSVEFLSIALPDQLATTLSYARGLSIRPFAVTRKYAGSNLDAQKAAREMGVSSIVTGRFLKGGDQLQVTVEALEVPTNRLLWQDTLDGPAANMIGMQRRLAATAREGLARALGSSSVTVDTATKPRNAEAYDLYIHSIALPGENDANHKAIAMLERAVALDPGFAPAWFALALRTYYDSQYSTGGEAAVQRSEAAVLRARELDPNLLQAGSLLVMILTERGQVVQAYQVAADSVRRRPDSADAHFALSYVLRYVGLLEEGASECDIARSLDPHNFRWRSCTAVFEQLGNYDRALDYIHLDDPNSAWAKTHVIQALLRQGMKQEAVAAGLESGPGFESFRLLYACAANRPAQEIAALAAALKPARDSELNYASAAHLAYCGRTAAALPLLRLSIEANHCSYPAMDTDPFFATMRSTPEFAGIRAAAISCRNNFLAERKRVDATR